LSCLAHEFCDHFTLIFFIYYSRPLRGYSATFCPPHG